MRGQSRLRPESRGTTVSGVRDQDHGCSSRRARFARNTRRSTPRALQIVDAWWIQLGNRVDRSELVRERLEKRTYVFSSYVLHLAADYLKRGSTNVDRNDFEDAKFCQHLALGAEMMAVTADVALQRCLQDTLAVLNELPDLSYHTKIQVSSVSDFMSPSRGSSE